MPLVGEAKDAVAAHRGRPRDLVPGKGQQHVPLPGILDRHHDIGTTVGPRHVNMRHGLSVVSAGPARRDVSKRPRQSIGSSASLKWTGRTIAGLCRALLRLTGPSAARPTAIASQASRRRG